MQSYASLPDLPTESEYERRKHGDTMLTARSAVVGLAPGRYQLATALLGKIHNGGWKKNRMPRKPRKPRHTPTTHQAGMLYSIYIAGLPDDESELWNRHVCV